ncbi:hypothetical protein BIY23_02530 [Wolbachia pipientis]|uniref:Fungal lipase-type domain-containing protein n=1 Tax=Wolbachia pipientis TaxID=955 RepID=A0A1E7QJQ9_WOLPI|nr:lipase family protein [Wolbachia pipientis]OEY86712.1 hypothetical protein BIY23_02530 [Wolbachia pipientis]
MTKCSADSSVADVFHDDEEVGGVYEKGTDQHICGGEQRIESSEPTVTIESAPSNLSQISETPGSFTGTANLSNLSFLLYLKKMCNFCKLVYCSDQKGLSKADEEKAGYKDRYYFEREEKYHLREAHYYYYYSRYPFERKVNFAYYYFTKDKEITIIFRGTQDRHDFAADADMRYTSLTTIPGCVGNVHSGFHRQFTSIEVELIQRLMFHVKNEEKRERLRDYTRKVKLSLKDFKINLVGHSLGGAIAQIAALHLNKQYGLQDLHVVTFGSPKVFDNEAAEVYNAVLKENSYRLVYECDIIPTFPPNTYFCNYTHVGIEMPLANKVNSLQNAMVRSTKPGEAQTSNGNINNTEGEKYSEDAIANNQDPAEEDQKNMNADDTSWWLGGWVQQWVANVSRVLYTVAGLKRNHSIDTYYDRMNSLIINEEVTCSTQFIAPNIAPNAEASCSINIPYTVSVMHTTEAQTDGNALNNAEDGKYDKGAIENNQGVVEEDHKEVVYNVSDGENNTIVTNDIEPQTVELERSVEQEQPVNEEIICSTQQFIAPNIAPNAGASCSINIPSTISVIRTTESYTVSVMQTTKSYEAQTDGNALNNAEDEKYDKGAIENNQGVVGEAHKEVVDNVSDGESNTIVTNNIEPQTVALERSVEQEQPVNEEIICSTQQFIAPNIAPNAGASCSINIPSTIHMFLSTKSYEAQTDGNALNNAEDEKYDKGAIENNQGVVGEAHKNVSDGENNTIVTNDIEPQTVENENNDNQSTVGSSVVVENNQQVATAQQGNDENASIDVRIICNDTNEHICSTVINTSVNDLSIKGPTICSNKKSTDSEAEDSEWNHETSSIQHVRVALNSETKKNVTKKVSDCTIKKYDQEISGKPSILRNKSRHKGCHNGFIVGAVICATASIVLAIQTMYLMAFAAGLVAVLCTAAYISYSSPLPQKNFNDDARLTHLKDAVPLCYISRI